MGDASYRTNQASQSPAGDRILNQDSIGANAMLKKPFEIQELLEAVSDQLE
jgi:DNA-binding response OmpR family regulator